jgi:rhamnogalacturonyl hydrolase YesR
MVSDVLSAFALLSFFLMVTVPSATYAQTSYSGDEVYKAAVEKGKRAVDFFTKSSGKSTGSDYYADICAFYASCIFGDAIGDKSIYEYINSKYTRTTAISTGDIDKNSCGILPLHLYVHNKNTQHLHLGKAAADGNIAKGGHYRGAVDDMYMTGSLIVQAYRATNDKKYLDFCAGYIVKYMDALQQSDGLFQHGANGSTQYWGRGNGWAAAGTAELVQILPEDHALYDKVITGYKKHMKGLVSAQLDSGMWPQILGSSDSKNWEETSGTAMFIFALFTGLELGILDEATYLEPAKKGWMAVIKYLSSDGKLGNIAGGFWPTSNTPGVYLDAKIGGAGDSHGTAGFIWAATAAVRYYKASTTVSRRSSYMSIRSVYTSQRQSLFDLSGRIIPTERFRLNMVPLSTGIIIRSDSRAKKALFAID